MLKNKVQPSERGDPAGLPEQGGHRRRPTRQRGCHEGWAEAGAPTGRGRAGRGSQGVSLT